MRLQKPPPGEPIRIEAVKYYWREWYTRVTEDTGRVLHWGPWNSQWAAQRWADLLAENYRRWM